MFRGKSQRKLRTSIWVIALSIGLGAMGAYAGQINLVASSDNHKKNQEMNKVKLITKELLERADTGDVQAQMEIAGYYYDKTSPSKSDSTEMIYWYERAAKNSSRDNRGDTGAHEQLGRLYCGEICLISPYRIKKIAREDFQQIAEQRNAAIQRHHIEPDYIKAYAHYILANLAPKRDIFSSDLKKIAAQMQEKEIQQAKSMANNWSSNVQGR